MKIFVILALFLSIPVMATHHEMEPTLKDIKDSMGIVPEFLSTFPQEGRAGAWEQMKTLQMNPKTALSGLAKEMIGMAVAAQIPCKYCLYFHKKAIKANGGSDEELKEALVLSSHIRYWATIFSGMQVDFKETKKEVDQIVKFKKKQREPGYKAQNLPPIEITDADSVYKDCERQFGLVPSVGKAVPKASIPGAYKILKSIIFNPNSHIPNKIKALIVLGVASQIPCKHCIYWETEMAKLYGASEQEIAEAVEMAATTRYWSTWLNGNQFDEKKFKKEVDKAFSHLEKKH